MVAMEEHNIDIKEYISGVFPAGRSTTSLYCRFPALLCIWRGGSWKALLMGEHDGGTGRDIIETLRDILVETFHLAEAPPAFIAASLYCSAYGGEEDGKQF